MSRDDFSSSGWDRLVNISDSELKGSKEETIDQLYVFLLTNKLPVGSQLANEPNRLTKLVNNLQTILRLKHAEFQEQITEYEEERGGVGGGADERLRQEKNQLEQLVIEQEKKLAQYEENSAVGVGGREVFVLRREIDDLRRELNETKRVLETERLESQRLSRELSVGNTETQRLQAEVSQRKDEIMEYHLHLERQKDYKKLSLVEGELRERLRIQEREMTEQLDRMEVLLKEKSAMEQELVNMANQLAQYEEGKVTHIAEMKKHQNSLIEATRVNTELERTVQRLQSELAHVNDQLNIQNDANRQLCERLNEETERAKFKITSQSEELTQAKERIVQLETQLSRFLSDTRKGSVVKLNKELLEKDREVQQLQDDLYQASQDIDSLSKQLQDTINQSDPSQVSPLLYKEIEELKVNVSELAKLLNNEQQRRQQSEADKEEGDRMVAEMREKLEQYERGQSGLKEAINEIKQRKEELSRKDSEISRLTLQANKLHKETDILYEINEELRQRLGMGPDEQPDLTEVRQRYRSEVIQLKEENSTLQGQVKRLEEEKLSLRKKVIEQATTRSQTNSVQSSPDHVTLADLRSQISQLHLSLNTERQRKEACQKEISRLSKEIISSTTSLTGSNKTSSKIKLDKTGQIVDEVDSGEESCLIRKENYELHNQLALLNQQYQLLMDTLRQKENEILTLKANSPYRATSTGIGTSSVSLVHYNKGVIGGDIVPPSSSDQLSLVIQELQDRETALRECQQQLQHYKKKFDTITHQQGLLYKEYHDMKDKWNKEKEQLEKEKYDFITNQQINQIKLDELKSLQDTLSADTSDTIKQTLGDYSRSITLLRVNERTLIRTNTLLQTNDTKLRKEVDHLKQEMSDMEIHFTEQLNYLRRYKESASYKLTNLQEQLLQCVPLTQLQEANTQYIKLSGQYNGLFQHLTTTIATATTTTGDVIGGGRSGEEKLRIMSEKLVSCEASLNELKLSIATNGECTKCIELRQQVSTLELSRTKLHQEISQLKDNLDLTQNQLVSLRERKQVKEKDLSLLRQQAIEVSSQSDQKTLIGQLQQQIMTLQLSEHQSQSQLHKLKSKLISAETQLLKTEQQYEEKEGTLSKNKSHYIDRIQRLTTLLQDLHRKYIGATLLPDQVKFSQLFSQIEKNKNETESLHKETDRKREEVETKLQELELEKLNLQELMASLKEDGGVGKVREIHTKLGELRLKELHYQKCITRLERELKHSQELVTGSEEVIKILEQKVVQTTKEYEELLLSLDERGIKKTTQLPVINNIREYNQETTVKCNHLPVISQLQSDIQTLQQQCNTLDSSLRRSETQLIDKDKTINELHLKISSLERLRDNDKRERETNTARSLQFTNETIDQLKSQLSQKETQVDKYQRLLQESRQEFQLSLENYKEEMMLMERKLQTKSNALSRLQDSVANSQQQPQVPNFLPLSLPRPLSSGGQSDNRRIQEVQETNRVLSRQLENEKKERETDKMEWIQREDELRKEMSQLKHKHRLEIKDLQSTLSSKSNQVTELEQELDIINGELSTALETSKKAPSRGVRELVERLRTQLVEKEQELKVLSESLKQVRAELVETVHKTLQSHSRLDASEINVHKLVMERVRAVEEREEEKMKDMKGRLVGLETELEDMRNRWKDKCLENEELQNDYQRKDKDCSEKGVLLERQESDMRQLKRSLNDAKTKEQSLNRNITQLRERLSSTEEELTRTRTECESLQNKIESQRQELQQEILRSSQEKAKSKATSMYQLDMKHTSLEVARWEEGKKWQRKVETLRHKISEKTKELESLQKYVSSLKDKLSKSDREKEVLSERLRTAEKSKPVVEPSVTKKDIEELFQLKSENYELQGKVSLLEHQLEGLRTNHQVEELRAEIQSLTDINSALKEEKKRSGISGSITGESKLREELLQSKKAHAQLQFQYQQAAIELPRLKSRVNDLEQYVKVLKDVSGNTKQPLPSEAKPGAYTASEVDKVVSGMKRVIERLQAENESLKNKVKRRGGKGDDERSILEMENRRLKFELDKVQRSLAALGGEKSESPLAGAINENERLRNELRKEIEKCEKLHVTVSKLKSDKIKLEEDLSKFSDPQKVVVKEREELKRENTQLKAELESFDPQFFEEIEDLKYNYQVSVQKNVEYEEQLRHYSRQYGFPLPNLLENDTE